MVARKKKAVWYRQITLTFLCLVSKDQGIMMLTSLCHGTAVCVPSCRNANTCDWPMRSSTEWFGHRGHVMFTVKFQGDSYNSLNVPNHFIRMDYSRDGFLGGGVVPGIAHPTQQKKHDTKVNEH